jgi:hypothetical protein
MDVLADAVEPMLRSDLHHCHEFVKAIGNLVALKHNVQTGRRAPPDIIDETSRMLARLRGITTQERRDLLGDVFDAEQLSRMDEAPAPGVTQVGRRRSPVILRRIRVKQQVERAIAASDYISEEVSRYYFGKAREYIAQSIVQFSVNSPGRATEGRPRIEVIDLPSFPDNRTRYVALNSVLTTTWERARSEWGVAISEPEEADKRVPTFVVVDEAHNLIPREHHDLAVLTLREQFRSIAAEGRKYGLF